MLRHRNNYWVYSAGLALAWGMAFLLAAVIRGGPETKRLLPVFGGFCIGWVSTTIARYVYPPPRRWTSSARPGGRPSE